MAKKNRHFADDGWAFWVCGEDTSTIYLNEWIDPRGKSFVDIGIRVRGILSGEEMNLYIPFPIKKEDIQDISHKLQEPHTFRAVFNAAGIMDVQKNAHTSEIAYHGKAVDLVHLSCLDYKVQPLAGGSLLTLSILDLKPSLANDEAYFLFRIPHKSLDEVFSPKVSIRSFFVRLRDLITTPVVAEKYGYSVRINEARLLPDEINRIGAFHRERLNKAVVTISVNEDYQLNDTNCYRIHRLEESLYRDYAPEDFCRENVITYQWNQTRENNQRGQYNFYFDISREAVSKSSMILYVILLFMVSMFSDGLWSLIQSLLGWQ